MMVVFEHKRVYISISWMKILSGKNLLGRFISMQLPSSIHLIWFGNSILFRQI